MFIKVKYTLVNLYNNKSVNSFMLNITLKPLEYYIYIYKT